MDTRIKRLFSRKFSSSGPKGHSYEKAVPLQSPIRGSFPISTNGQYAINTLEHHDTAGKQSIPESQILDSSAAAAPDIPRNQRWNTNTGDSQSLHHLKTAVTEEFEDLKSPSRTFSGLSMKSAPVSRRKRRTSSVTVEPVEDVDTYIPPVPKYPPRYLNHTREKSSHVDIIAAASLKQHGSGRRDYGEDVADRNMTFHSSSGSESHFTLNSPDSSYIQPEYLREKSSSRRNKSRGHSYVSSALDHDLQEGKSNINDDVGGWFAGFSASSPIKTRISSGGRPKSPTKRTLTSRPSLLKDDHSDSKSIFVSKTQETSIISTYQLTGNPIQAATPYQLIRPAVPPRSEARSLSITSNSSRETLSTMRETMRDGSPVSKLTTGNIIDGFVIKGPIQGQRATTRERSPLSKSIDSSMVATAAATSALTGKKGTRLRARSEAGSMALAASRSVLEQKDVEPLPQRRPATATYKPPIPPPMISDTFQKLAYTPTGSPRNINSSPTRSARSASATRSRASSVTYSPFPKTKTRPPSASRQGSETPGTALSTVLKATSNKFSTDVSPRSKSINAQTRARITAGGTSEAPAFMGIVDLNDSVDTRVSTNTLPAVTHEIITPRVQNIQEEQITREIHTHDVYHHIQPVIDTEVLPTKHYIRNNAGDLVEIPASVVSSNPEKWHTEDSWSTCSTSLSSDSVAPPAIQSNRSRQTSISTQKNYPHLVSEQPIMSSTRTSTMTSGAPRTESIWRFSRTAEGSNLNPSRNHTAGSRQIPAERQDEARDRYDDSESESSQSCRSEDSTLLFRDTGYGGGSSGYGGGMLPGLHEFSPVANAYDESEATKALRRKIAEMNVR